MDTLSEKQIERVMQFLNNKRGIELQKSGRQQQKVILRQCLGYVLNKKYGLTTTKIAELLQQDHSTVVYGNRKVGDMLELKNVLYITGMLDVKEGVAYATASSDYIQDEVEAIICTALTNPQLKPSDIINAVNKALITVLAEGCKEE